MNGYKAFYRDKTIEVHALTSYDARQQAAALFKVRPRKEYEVHVYLCEQTNNQPTNQTTNQPTNQPTKQTTKQTTNQPTNQTNKQPTNQTNNQPKLTDVRKREPNEQ